MKKLSIKKGNSEESDRDGGKKKIFKRRGISFYTERYYRIVSSRPNDEKTFYLAYWPHKFRQDS